MSCGVGASAARILHCCDCGMGRQLQPQFSICCRCSPKSQKKKKELLKGQRRPSLQVSPVDNCEEREKLGEQTKDPAETLFLTSNQNRHSVVTFLFSFSTEHITTWTNFLYLLGYLLVANYPPLNVSSRNTKDHVWFLTRGWNRASY